MTRHGVVGPAEKPSAGGEDPPSPRSVAEIKRRLEAIERRARSQRPTAWVTSAIPLPADQRAAFEQELRARLGSDLVIEFQVDPAVLGGVVVRVGDRVVDGSLATRLSHLRGALIGSGGSVVGVGAKTQRD